MIRRWRSLRFIGVACSRSIDPGELADIDLSGYESFSSPPAGEGRVTESGGVASDREDLRGRSSTVLEGECVGESSGEDDQRRTSTSEGGLGLSEFDSVPDDPLALATGEGMAWLRYPKPPFGRPDMLTCDACGQQFEENVESSMKILYYDREGRRREVEQQKRPPRCRICSCNVDFEQPPFYIMENEVAHLPSHIDDETCHRIIRGIFPYVKSGTRKDSTPDLSLIHI